MSAKKYEFSVQGMSCMSCVGRVEKALLKQSGVQSAKVDLQAERAVVEVDTSSVTPEVLKVAISKAGYESRLISG